MHDAAPLTPGSPGPDSSTQLTDARLGASAVGVAALEVMSDLLLGVGEGSPPDAFFSSLCEAICRLTSTRRAVLFRYDRARRRMRAVGAHVGGR